jgi:hypothetical protein
MYFEDLLINIIHHINSETTRPIFETLSNPLKIIMELDQGNNIRDENQESQQEDSQESH